MFRKEVLIVLILLVFFISGCEKIQFSQINIPETFTSGEETQEITGNLETIIVDDFENNKAGYLYYLNDGKKKYELKFVENKKLNYLSGEIKIEGIIQEDEILVYDIIQSPLKDVRTYPYITGNQKYAVVYLFEEGDPEFDPFVFTNISFNLTNNFILNSSYEKASISADYVGYLIINSSTDMNFISFRDYAIENIDQYVDFSEFDGIIIYHPNIENITEWAGLASVGKIDVFTDEGNVKLYSVYVNFEYSSAPYEYEVLIHEIGHNFGLAHSSFIDCGEFPNRTVLDLECLTYEYGDPFNVMGFSSFYGDYDLANKVEILGWINNSNVFEVQNGTFFISPFESDSTGTSDLHGLKIPIIWNKSIVVHNIWNDFYYNLSGYSDDPYSTNMGATHYFLEYRSSLKGILSTYYSPNFLVCSEFTYGLNSSKITRGLLVRLGGEGNGTYTFRNNILNMHPNVELGIGIDGNCSHTDRINDSIYSSYFAFLLEGESYLDKFNRINITVLKTNESGALVKISPYYSCGDWNIQSPNSYGQNEECDDGNQINTDSCTNECRLPRPNDGICSIWEGGRERCGECAYDGDTFECSDCLGYIGSIAECPDNEICTDFEPELGIPGYDCAVSCSYTQKAGCFWQECPRTYTEILSSDDNIIPGSCDSLGEREEWLCCAIPESELFIKSIETLIPDKQPTMQEETNIFKKIYNLIFVDNYEE